MTELIQAPITQSQAAQALIEWEAKVQALETALQQLRAHQWQLALAGQGAHVAKQLRILENELVTARLAFELAIEQQTAVCQAAQAQRQRAEADALERRAAEYAELLKEWAPEVAYARQHLGWLVKRAGSLRLHADQIEVSLRSRIINNI